MPKRSKYIQGAVFPMSALQTPHTLQELVRQYIVLAPEGLSVPQIAARVKYCKKNNIYALVYRLLQQGRIRELHCPINPQKYTAPRESCGACLDLAKWCKCYEEPAEEPVEALRP